MLLQRKSDLWQYGSLEEALEAFMCPGPCSPDCPLYPVQYIPETNKHVHMCHESYYKTHQTTVADAIGCVRISG